MDCEGCEFGITKNSDLSIFDEIMMEYHSKIVGINKEEIEKELIKYNFKVDIKKIFNNDIDDFGIIHAYK